MSLRRLLRERMYVQTQTVSNTVSAANSYVWPTGTPTIRCQRQQTTSTRRIELGVETLRPMFVLLFESSTTLDTIKRVLIDGTSYEVLEVRPSVDSRKPSRADIVEVTT